MSKQKYFSDCITLQQAKAKYKVLLKTYHPDNGGDLRIMQEINAEFAKVKRILPDIELDENQEEQAESVNNANNTGEISDVLQNIIRQTETIPGINVELCGKWVWVSGNTYPVKDRLKELGFCFSGKKKMWYFREESENKKRYHKHKDTDMSTIRTKYGSKAYQNVSAALA